MRCVGNHPGRQGRGGHPLPSVSLCTGQNPSSVALMLRSGVAQRQGAAQHDPTSAAEPHRLLFVRCGSARIVAAVSSSSTSCAWAMHICICMQHAAGPWPAQQLNPSPPRHPAPPQPSQAGCKHCHDTPFASRPIARAKPEQGRYHNTLPAAPTFHPTAEEWEDPFAYLGKIAAEATKAGIALIVPPKGWEPPIQMLDQETGQLRTDLQVGVHTSGHCSRPIVSLSHARACARVPNSSTWL